MCEYKEMNGLVYANGDGKFWRFQHFVHRDDMIIPQNPLTGHPHVICDCGSGQFSLRYGDYEMFAKCVDCGLEESVYSG